MRIIPGRLCVAMLAILSLLIFVPRNLPAQDPAAASAAAPPLSDAQLKKLVADVKERNQQNPTDPALTKLLGLSKDGEALTFQFIAIQDSQSIFHGFMVREGTPGYLLLQRIADKTMFFYLDASLHVVTAASKLTTQQDYSLVPLEETAKPINDELLWWANAVDKLLSQ